MSNEEKNCPYCGETIKSVAIKCKHCQSDLNAPEADDSGKINNKINQFKEVPLEEKEFKIVNKYIIIIIFLVIILSVIKFIPIFSIVQYSGLDADTFVVYYYSDIWYFCYLIAFLLIGYLDLLLLKKNNIKIKYGILSLLFLPPAYLYLRGIELNKIYKESWIKSQKYLIAWLFILPIGIILNRFFYLLLRQYF
jgi:hypothetical protein